MRHRTPRIALLALALVALPIAAGRAGEDEAPEDRPLHTKPYLWVVEGPVRVFLFGTIHVPEQRVLDLPEIVLQAFEASDTVSTELKMDLASMLQVNQVSARLSAMPEDTKLSGVLSGELRARVAARLPASMSLDRFEDRQPWFVGFTLLQLQLLPHLGSGQPLDLLLYTRAQEGGKEVDGIETAETQLRVFADLTMDEQIRMLEQTVTGLEEMEASEEDPIAELVDLYLRGDAEALMEALNAEFDPEDELGRKVRTALLDRRNVGMADYVLRKIEDDAERTHFIAVGAGHLAGDVGIPALLRAKGFTVTRLKVGDPLPQATTPTR